MIDGPAVTSEYITPSLSSKEILERFESCGADDDMDDDFDPELTPSSNAEQSPRSILEKFMKLNAAQIDSHKKRLHEEAANEFYIECVWHTVL